MLLSNHREYLDQIRYDHFNNLLYAEVLLRIYPYQFTISLRKHISQTSEKLYQNNLEGIVIVISNSTLKISAFWKFVSSTYREEAFGF